MEGAFNELEKRFHDQSAEHESAPRGAEHDGGEKPAAQP
jgi:hypothetical protein